MITKFMGTQGFTWFIGTVEDNNDPAKLGRLKVRCHGYHSDDPSEVLTEHLPWATVLQPTTSAGLRGGGVSPTGALIGTQVMGFFADGPVAQYPIVFGVLGGINNFPSNGRATLSSPEGVKDPAELTGRVQEGNTDQSAQQAAVAGGALGNLSAAQLQELKNTIGQRESNGNYRAENQFGYVGKYQFGLAALYDEGYVNVKPPRAGESYRKANGETATGPWSRSEYSTLHTRLINTDSTWTGKNGITSKDTWLGNSAAQEQAMDNFLKRNYQTLLRLGTVTAVSEPRELAGILMVAHLLGPGGADIYKRTGRGRDGNNTSGHAYYRLGFNSISDDTPRMA